MEERTCWNNCRTDPSDDEIRRIDAMKDALSPLSSDLKAVRGLITSLEMCHHKAERWMSLIVEAIATGGTSKGPGTRAKGSRHPVEDEWDACIRVLTGWCEGTAIPSGKQVGAISVQDFISVLGEPTALKKWQVRTVIDKIRSYAQADAHYVEIAEDEEHAASGREFRQETMSALIRDHVDGEPAEISLSAAIDHLEACHWDFAGNLTIVLRAIGGDLAPEHSYATCGRNINLSPLRPRMKTVSDALRAFWDDSFTTPDADVSTIRDLGHRTLEKRWLAASLDKTIRLQFGL